MSTLGKTRWAPGHPSFEFRSKSPDVTHSPLAPFEYNECNFVSTQFEILKRWPGLEECTID